jgi:hypothetical protein
VRREVEAVAMGHKRPVQQPLFVRSDELAWAPRHQFYEKLNELLDSAGFDATYLRADASMKSIVRRGSGEGYKSYLEKLAKKAGIENPTDEDARRMDRGRDKETSNDEWVSPTDPEAENTRLEDGRTRLGYKAESTVDMERGAVLAAEILLATTPDGESVITSVEQANASIAAARDGDDDHNDGGTTVPADGIKEVVGDKGFHEASTIKRLADAGIRTYFPERKQRGQRRWKKNGGRATGVAAYPNPACASSRARASACNDDAGHEPLRLASESAPRGGRSTASGPQGRSGAPQPARTLSQTRIGAGPESET